MAPNKQSIEINCVDCKTHFRLWVPFELLREWEKGARISCIKCGAQHFIKKGRDGFDINRLHEIKTEEKAPLKQAPARPVPKPPAPPPQVKPAQAKTVQAKPVQVPDIPIPEPPVMPAAEANKDIVLVVEDDRLSREMVEQTLKDLGVNLVYAKNATEAVRALRKDRVRLIVTDLYLKNPADPEAFLDGEELLKKVADSGLDIPSIITTGKDIIDDLVLDPKWFELHVKGFIQKGNPFWADELKLKVKEILYKG